MLILTRLRDQDVIFELNGVQVGVRVVEIRGNKVRLGFSAPRDVVIHRCEIFELEYEVDPKMFLKPAEV